MGKVRQQVLRVTRALTRVRRLSLPRILLLVEALLHLAVASAAIACLRYKDFESTIANGAAGQPDKNGMASARQIGSAIQRLARIVPWRADCLIQAAAARWMLRRRQIPNRLYIGVAKPTHGLAAHAWLISGEFFVTGRPGHQGFDIIRTL